MPVQGSKVGETQGQFVVAAHSVAVDEAVGGAVHGFEPENVLVPGEMPKRCERVKRGNKDLSETRP